MRSVLAFDRVAHLTRVPVDVGSERFPFLVDTGIGITVVSSAFARRADVVTTGETFSAQRMSGQVVEVALVRLPELRVGDHTVASHLAGVLDLGADGDFMGILGPGCFEGFAVTTDPDRMTLTIEESAAVQVDGFTVAIEVRRNGPSYEPFGRLVLPSGRTISVEIDTGSANLILATRHLSDCDLTVDHPDLTTTTGVDETGQGWTRRHATIPGAMHLADAPETTQFAPKVQFQDIIHDGLVGTDYLGRYRVTFDVTGGRMILAPRGG